MITIAALAIFTACTGGGSQRTDFPLQDGQFRMAKADYINALTIVSPTSRLPLSKRPGFVAGEKLSVNIDEAEVVSSASIDAGTQIRIVAPWSETDGNLYPLVPGHRYLVLARKAENGLLAIPTGSWLSLSGEVSYSSLDPQELSGLAVFETHQTALYPGGDPGETLVNSIADCLVGADDAGTARVCAFLKQSRYPGVDVVKVAAGQGDFPLSLRIRTIAENSTPVRKALLYQLLNSWAVYDTAEPYVEAVEDCAGNAGTFSAIGSLDDVTFRQNANNGIHPPEVHRFNPDRWADAVTNCRNDEALRFLLANAAGVADAKYEPQIAKWLYHAEPVIQRLTATYLARAHNDKAHAPRAIKKIDRRTGLKSTEYSNLPEVVAYWKAKFPSSSHAN